MKNKSLRIIDKIQKIRQKNNRNWMNLLRLAFKKDQKMLLKYSPKLLVWINKYPH